MNISFLSYEVKGLFIESILFIVCDAIQAGVRSISKWNPAKISQNAVL